MIPLPEPHPDLDVLLHLLRNPWGHPEQMLREGRIEAADELERLMAHIEKVEQWQREGEGLFSRRGLGAAFHLGAWWADRPWRVRSSQNQSATLHFDRPPA